MDLLSNPDYISVGTMAHHIEKEANNFQCDSPKMALFSKVLYV